MLKSINRPRIKFSLIVLSVLILLLWSERKILIVNTGIGNRIFELLYTLCMLVSLSAVLYYLFFENDSKSNNRISLKYYLLLLAVQTIAFLPLYTQNFMYGDDLWGFASNYEGQLDNGLYFSRPFIDFLLGVLPDTSFLSIRYFRLYNGFILFIFGCVLFKYLVSKGMKENASFCFASLAIAGCFAVDCIAYASIYPINISLLLSAVSCIYYLKAVETAESKQKCMLLLVSVACLFTAFCMYQLGTTIVFLLYIVSEKASTERKEWKRFSRAFVYLIFYGTITVLYLAASRILGYITGISAGQSARGVINLSADSILFKAKWFATDVIPQTLTRIVGTISGNIFYKENNMFYQCNYKLNWLGMIFNVCLLALIVLFIAVTAFRKKSGVYLLICLTAIPLSFWPFLVLPESVYLTYYAMGTILLFLWYIFGGITVLLQAVSDKLILLRGKTLTPSILYTTAILIIVILQSNYYAENAWVNYCRDSYEFLANTIAGNLNSSDEIDTISVQGQISPYVGGHDYVIFCVQNILTELGKEPGNFTILQSDNAFYINIFNDNEANKMKNILGTEQMDKLLQFYEHDNLYSRWCYRGNANDAESLVFLRDSFVKTGQMTLYGKNVLSISMDGFNMRNPF